MKKRTLLLPLLLMFLPLAHLAAENFTFENYSVEINVLENNSYEITETLDVDFTVSSHGIIRNIPLYFDKIPVKISKINVEGFPSKITKGRDQVAIRIGSASVTRSGKVRYVISYLYDVGKDGLPDMDEFYFNIIGTQWATDIHKADFRVTMPKSFDPSRLNCTSGPLGSTDNTNVKWAVDGNVITGHIVNPLGYNEGLTLALPLPEGYWVGAKRHLGPNWIFSMVLSYPLHILAAVLSFLLWYAKGRDNKLFPTVQFEPPEGMTPAEIGYIIDGQVDDKDVNSLIVYWAEKGYLAIEEEKDEKGKTKELALVKLQEPGPETQYYERKIFKDLFSNGTGGRVTTSDLRNSFYKTIQWAVTNITQTFTKHKEKRIFASGTQGASFLAGLLAFLPLFSLLMEVFLPMKGNGPLWVFAFFIAVFAVVPYVILGKAISTGSGGDKSSLTMGIAFSLVVTAVIAGLTIFLAGIDPLRVLSTVAASMIASFFISIMSKRTEYGDKMLELVLGFREFIKEAEKDKLETLFASDPAYFYNILPYAMVLGLSSQWASHFENMAVPPPTWYWGNRYDRFDTRTFDRDLSRSFNSLSSSMSSSPSGSSGGSSSGGSSGGGAGGGGGSSW